MICGGVLPQGAPISVGRPCPHSDIAALPSAHRRLLCHSLACSSALPARNLFQSDFTKPVLSPCFAFKVPVEGCSFLIFSPCIIISTFKPSRFLPSFASGGCGIIVQSGPSRPAPIINKVPADVILLSQSQLNFSLTVSNVFSLTS